MRFMAIRYHGRTQSHDCRWLCIIIPPTDPNQKNEKVIWPSGNTEQKMDSRVEGMGNTRKRIQPGMLVKEIEGRGIVQVGPDGKAMISVSRIGRVLPFDSDTKIGSSCATSGRSQYIYVDFTKKLNPSL